MRSLCELHSSDSASTRRQKLQSRISRYLPAAEIPRVAEFLSELCNIPLSDPISPPLRAARGEPALMNDQLSWAFVDWLRAECEQHPVLLVLEDLHFGDEPTIKLVDNALRQLKTQPLMVLALARPEVRTRFPGLWSGRVQEVILAPLSQKACERFIAQVLDASPDPAEVRRIVRQSAGNALYLEELIRAAAEDKDRGGEPPATVLAMLQARLQQLSPDLRCILRAASVFGATFSQAGVLALVGVDGDGAEAETALSSLVQAMRLLPLTMRVRALLGQGRTAESMLAADDGLAQLRELGTAGYGELALRLAVVEAYRAGGRQAAAHQALTEALQQLHLRAARIPDEQVRSCFLTRVPDNIRLLELGQNGR
jgi:predicted ATPase